MIATNPDIVRCPYDVGDVLITASDTQPSTRWPGTSWYQIQGCFLLAASEKYAVGSTGGEEYHVLTQEELPEYAYGACYSGNSSEQKNYPWREESPNGSMGYANLRRLRSQQHAPLPGVLHVAADGLTSAERTI